MPDVLGYRAGVAVVTAALAALPEVRVFAGGCGVTGSAPLADVETAAFKIAYVLTPV